MPNYIRVKQIDPTELTGAVNSVIESQSFKINVDTATGIVLKDVGQLSISGANVDMIDSSLSISGNLNVGGSIQGNINLTVTNVVYVTGDQSISGNKNFRLRPVVNNTGFILSGDPVTNMPFSGNRTIKRSSFPSGINVSGNDVISFLNNLFFPFIPATMTLAGYSLRELGTTYSNIPINGTITQNDETLAGLGNLRLFITGNNVLTTPGNFGPFTYTSTSSVTGSSIVSGTLNVNNNGFPTIISSTQPINFEAPHYWGSGLANLTPAQITGGLTKQLVSKSNLQYTYNTTNSFFWLAYPSGWGTLSLILDPNSFDITSSFITSGVNLTLANGALWPYRIYRSLSASTNSNFTIRFNF